MGLFSRVARKKSYMNMINHLKRLKYAKEMLRKPFDFRDNIIWLDKTYLGLMDEL